MQGKRAIKSLCTVRTILESFRISESRITFEPSRHHRNISWTGLKQSPYSGTITNSRFDQLWLNSGPLFQLSTTLLGFCLFVFSMMSKEPSLPLITLSGTAKQFDSIVSVTAPQIVIGTYTSHPGPSASLHRTCAASSDHHLLSSRSSEGRAKNQSLRTEPGMLYLCQDQLR